MIELVKNKQHQVVKRDGRIEDYSEEKLKAVILWACDGKEAFANQLLSSVSIKIYNQIPIGKLYDEVISTASNMISDLYPQWEIIARNLYLLKIHKDLGVKRTEYPTYSDVIATNIAAGLYDEDIVNKLDIPTLSKAINPFYDSLFTFGGINLFVQKYCNKYKKQLIELPQHVYMRVAINLMYKDGTNAIIDKYNQLASMSVTEATPKVVNALRPNASMFSCCLVRPSDSQGGILEATAMLTREAKYSGGTAEDISLIRAPGAYVEGNNGISAGVIPYIQGLQTMGSGFNQGSTRSFAAAVTFDAFHYQSPELAHLKHESGKDEDRARKLQYSVKWNRKLSNAVKHNEDIYLIDPHKTQDLFNSFGEAWNELYDKACRNTHIRKRKYNARELVYEFARTSADTGNLYYFFTDNANEQDIGAGFVPASNLCVTGDTKILTKVYGHIPIEQVVGQTLECWNGREWSMTPLFKTSNGQKVLTVVLSNGTEIQATPYHKWYIGSEETLKRTNELSVGDKVPTFDVDTYVDIVSIIDNGEIKPTYCGTEPLRNRLMFNGILTGNCQEMMMSYEPIELVESKVTEEGATFSYKGDIALCNLASINLVKWIELPNEKAKYDFMYLLVKSADNAIDNSFYINPLGKRHSLHHRNLGIGTSNYANVLASNKLLWDSEGARRLTHELYEEISFYAVKASIQLAKERSRCPVFNETKWAKGLFVHELSKLGKSESSLNYPLRMDWESLRPDLLKYGIRNSRLLAIAPTATSGKCINATEGVDAPRKLKTIQEGTYSLPFVVPNLKENREYYQTTFQIDNKDVIELAAIRQKFLCMSQSVSLAYTSLTSAFEHISNIIYAEELGLKTIYYTHTQKAGEEPEGCESCGS